jgi:hypothetical protein
MDERKGELRSPVTMIQSKPENIEQIRERLRGMSDNDLLRYGQASRYMADPKNNHGDSNPAIQVQLDEARAEWKRRHPGFQKRQREYATRALGTP